MKPLFSKDELKPKGRERSKIFIPDKLVKVRQRGKPSIEFSWGDRWNQFTDWFQGYAVDLVTRAIKRIVPGYVWILLVVGILVIVLVVVL